MDGREAIRLFEASGVRLFVGVPDSLMKGFCSALDENVGPSENVVTANEGAAVALAAGHYLSTGTPAVVYMQNSGLGNAVNPLSSLASKQVYGIPMVLLIGWRGEPGVEDEPQHQHQGAITRAQLELLDVPVTVIGPDDDVAAVIASAASSAGEADGPVAILVRKGTFTGEPRQAASGAFTRMAAIRAAVEQLPSDTVFVATTGYTGRELALLREERGEDWQSDLLMVGSMGHASALALGIAKGAPSRLVCCLDGDGALAMHMGSMACIGREAPANLIHVVLNNRVHESVGGQPSVLGLVDLPALARSVGYANSVTTDGLAQLESELSRAATQRGGPTLVEAKITRGSLDDLPRPSDFARRARDLRAWLADG